MQDDFKKGFFENSESVSDSSGFSNLSDVSSQPTRKRKTSFSSDTTKVPRKTLETFSTTCTELSKITGTTNKVSKRTVVNPNPLNRERSVPPGPTGNETKFQFDKRCLLKYLELHGDMIVPQFFLVPWTDAWPEDMWGARLGRLVDRIRQLHSHKDKKEELSSIGFVFSNQKKINFMGNWEIIKLALGKYKEFNGHLQIIQRFVVPSSIEWPEITWGLKLGNFVKYVQKKNAYAEHRSTLLEMGIIFKSKTVFDAIQCGSPVVAACDTTSINTVTTTTTTATAIRAVAKSIAATVAVVGDHSSSTIVISQSFPPHTAAPAAAPAVVVVVAENLDDHTVTNRGVVVEEEEATATVTSADYACIGVDVTVSECLNGTPQAVLFAESEENSDVDTDGNLLPSPPPFLSARLNSSIIVCNK